MKLDDEQESTNVGAQYQKPKLFLFTGNTPSARGTVQATTGPLYWPGDKKVYGYGVFQ